jgi:hypothetical protein
MNLHARWILPLGVMLVLACGDDKGSETTAAPTTTGAQTTTTDPTTTGDTTGTPTTSGAESSTGEPAHSCLIHADQAACTQDPQCQWKGAVQLNYGAQGCQGSISEFCIEKDQAGGASAWYHDVGGQPQVVEFGYTPAGLDPEWKPCTCDGPLGCLCSSVSEDCPERLDEFCGGISTEMGCELASIKESSRCAWLSLSSEGPNDGLCADGAQTDKCIPAANGDATMCMPPVYTYPECIGFTKEVFWRDNDGIIDTVVACGPQPIGYTRCEADDTPEQPDECKCRCL